MSISRYLKSKHFWNGFAEIFFPCLSVGLFIISTFLFVITEKPLWAFNMGVNSVAVILWVRLFVKGW